LIALNEELFFRGFVLEGLRPQGWRWAIIGSAALFGASHTVNLVAGANLPFTFMQIAATTAGGVAFAAIRIRTGSLWPVIVLHVILDVMALTTLTGDAVDMPINTRRGLRPTGHPVGATGLSQIYEAVSQLRGTHPNQVKNAGLGLTHNLGGTGVACTVNILARPDV
jgi:acetyl-CoA acetyltransferase